MFVMRGGVLPLSGVRLHGGTLGNVTHKFIVTLLMVGCLCWGRTVAICRIDEKCGFRNEIGDGTGGALASRMERVPP